MKTSSNPKETADSLSHEEKIALDCLKDQKEKFLEEIAKQSQLKIDSIRRAIAWLEQKKLVETSAQQKNFAETAKKEELPETRLLQFLKQKKEIQLSELKKNFPEKEFGFALGKCRQNNWIEIKEGKAILTATGKQAIENGLEETKLLKEAEEKKAIELLTEKQKQFLEELKQRGYLKESIEKTIKAKITKKGHELALTGLDLKKQSNQLTTEMLVTGKWKETTFREYNLLEPVEEQLTGKKHAYIQFLSQVRQKLIALGFEEIHSPLIVEEFYNFDVLFQPQNHPARSWTDTYQLLKPKTGKLPNKEIVKKIKEMHETGGTSDSKGWNYNWNEDIAIKLMPTAHATAHSARQLIKGIKVPGKYFALARCYRPDVVDATHLIEFNQLEGFVIGEKISFKHLLGMLKQFAIEFAHAEETKFLPDYYPFTEPSVQLSVKHKELGWIELGGAGMFRPEMLENLGIKGQAIAWGIGIDRLAMLSMKTKDIRNLFSDNLEWLRTQPNTIIE